MTTEGQVAKVVRVMGVLKGRHRIHFTYQGKFNDVALFTRRKGHEGRLLALPGSGLVGGGRGIALSCLCRLCCCSCCCLAPLIGQFVGGFFLLFGLFDFHLLFPGLNLWVGECYVLSHGLRPACVVLTVRALDLLLISFWHFYY